MTAPFHAILPALGCRCRACGAKRAELWAQLTEAQRRALHALRFAVPRHPSDLAARDRVTHPTLHALMFPRGDRPALIRQHELGPRLWSAQSMPFFTLNQHGREIVAAARHLQRKAE